ncbi:unnamed protein product [Prunus armeniaca]|uniref:At1g61320/AtMIF1 LRR domain-containing protein n=1 Tax=Prunus armeniaca TaxID=36596 RepID=A0A6J5XCP5_PRUAR|nr:unnamed protein product [Prunus armeniaca]
MENRKAPISERVKLKDLDNLWNLPNDFLIKFCLSCPLMDGVAESQIGPTIEKLSEYRALKYLYLKSVEVTRRDIKFVLSSCPCLERLKVSNCPNLTSLIAVGSHFGLNLKYLAIEAWQDGMYNI